MYDDFGADYDRFINWQARLQVELPFLDGQLQAANARCVLDVACGTGMHAVALAQRDYQVVGADLSPAMVERAQLNAAAAGVGARFEVAGFGELSTEVGKGFGAVLCLGNSLPHLLSVGALDAALADFRACLRKGGLLLIQNRNFDAVVARSERWMDPQAHREGDLEWLFLRFYDFRPDGKLVFNVMTIQREGAGRWSQSVASTLLRPQLQQELTTALAKARFGSIDCYGDMRGAPFDKDHSPNLVVTAYRAD